MFQLALTRHFFVILQEVPLNITKYCSNFFIRVHTTFRHMFPEIWELIPGKLLEICLINLTSWVSLLDQRFNLIIFNFPLRLLKAFPKIVRKTNVLHGYFSKMCII